MIYSAQAERQIDELCRHYERLNRIEAVKNLIAALVEAENVIGNDATAGLEAPRPYPKLVKSGRLWLKAGRFWIAYTIGPHRSADRDH